MYGQLALLMQHHEINLKEVFEYPIEPYPWPLFGSVGELRKACKSTLLQVKKKELIQKSKLMMKQQLY